MTDSGQHKSVRVQRAERDLAEFRPQLGQLRQQRDALQAQIDGTSTTPPTSLQRLRDGVAQLERELTEARNVDSPNPPEAVRALHQQIRDAIERRRQHQSAAKMVEDAALLRRLGFDPSRPVAISWGDAVRLVSTWMRRATRDLQEGGDDVFVFLTTGPGTDTLSERAREAVRESRDAFVPSPTELQKQIREFGELLADLIAARTQTRSAIKGDEAAAEAEVTRLQGELRTATQEIEGRHTRAREAFEQAISGLQGQLRELDSQIEEVEEIIREAEAIVSAAQGTPGQGS